MINKCNFTQNLFGTINNNRIMKHIVFFTLLAAFASCKTIKYVPVETVKTEYIERLKSDSVLVYDSVFIKEKGDTVFIEKYKYAYKTKTQIDSIFKSDTIQVPYEVEIIKEVKKPLNWFQQLQIWVGRIVMISFLLFLAYIIYCHFWKK